jgi:hypothetical protein
MIGHTANEARSIDGYSMRAPTMENHDGMELWQARCVQGYIAVHLRSKINWGDLAKVMQFSRC